MGLPKCAKKDAERALKLIQNMPKLVALSSGRKELDALVGVAIDAKVVFDKVTTVKTSDFKASLLKQVFPNITKLALVI